ncbi:hypothetical protein BOX15_Mlig000233g2 [Macrostomum lignano]|uniref:Mitochondrial uncoupling protein 4 n=2 Tax=Macrostomum lignano TaxID=282301 RepID=A0A1I8FZ39_9PLAT|nr:hypothetical protein BOX15_Mlig000233g3 [Macrostomum lignano]PAA66206.1 hypothetical protein BOX15_Mlig000233g2 [Macrostomum lignano]
MSVKFLDVRSFVYGGTASVFAEFGTFPLDTAKTRLMVQGQRQTASEIVACRYKGMLHTFYKICLDEGHKALFKGLSVALIRQASYGTIKVGIYESLKPHAAASIPFAPKDTMLNNIMCAAVAGTVSSCCATPTDVLKVRLQASGLCPSNRYTGSLINIFRTIYREEGLRGLWRGTGPTAQRATLICSVQLPTYEAAKRFLTRHQLLKDGGVCHFVSSIGAGVASAAACNPIDVIKSRMMNQHYSSCSTKGAGLYTSSWDCLLQTCRAEGLRALWKGLVPNCMRLGPWNIIFFLTMERLKALDATVSSIEASDIESVLGKSQEIAVVSLEIVDGDVCLKDLRAN